MSWRGFQYFEASLQVCNRAADINAFGINQNNLIVNIQNRLFLSFYRAVPVKEAEMKGKKSDKVSGSNQFTFKRDCRV